MLNWRALRVVGSDRSAIFSESFPSTLARALASFPEALAAFDQAAALGVLVELTDQWPDLPPDPAGTGRLVVRGLPAPGKTVVVLVFYAVEVRAGQIIVTSAEPFHH